jgi:hypothetical protein
MTKKSLLPLLGLALAMVFAAPSKANAEVFVGVNIGPVVARPGYVYAARPYPYRYYGPRVVVAPPVVVRPWGGYYHPRYYGRPYARRYYAPHYYRR